MVSGPASPNSPQNTTRVPDPARIHTLRELADGLNALRGSRSYRELIAAARRQPPRDGRQLALATSTLSDLLNGKSVPGRDTLVTFLTACGFTQRDEREWLAAWERVRTAHLARPAGAARVRDANARLLGVHASIQTDPSAGDLPIYVDRDLDADLRTAITAAAAGGRMVLLTGGSSVGKTRTLFEAVRAALPDWWLLHPADPAAIGTFAQAPAPRTVLWLDELQRYLDHAVGLTAGTVRALITAGVVVVATLWPDEYTTRTRLRTLGQPDLHASDRELLRMARVIDVPEAFTAAERGRVETLAETDPRLRLALDSADVGITQILAAGPELVRRWENAPAADCYGKAVITAALDARRIGAHAPLSEQFLKQAAPAYLTSRQQATAPADWLTHALNYATTQLHGAASCLTPHAAEMGRIAGYSTADYLHQYALRVRHTEPVPETVWHSLIAYHHPDDMLRIIDNAERHGKPEHAITLCRHASDGDDTFFVSTVLARLLDEQGRVDELRLCADAGNMFAVLRLAELLVEQGRVDDAIAALRHPANAGRGSVDLELARLLAEHGRVNEATAVLRPRAHDGDVFAILKLLDVLVEHGRADELEKEVIAGTSGAARQLAQLRTAQPQLQASKTGPAVVRRTRNRENKSDPNQIQ